jgi:hypothetical protein
MAINSLKGILLGINLDGKVNDQEIEELKNWCNKHALLINRNPLRILWKLFIWRWKMPVTGKN